MNATETLLGPGIKVELDAGQIVPSDPGKSTPVLLVLDDGRSTSWNCTKYEGEVPGISLTDEQREWLDRIAPSVDEWAKRHQVPGYIPSPT